MWVSINGDTPIASWLRMENPIEMDDLGVPLFQETSILPTPKGQQMHTRRAYAAYAALQSTHDQPAQHIMQLRFYLHRYQDLQEKYNLFFFSIKGPQNCDAIIVLTLWTKSNASRKNGTMHYGFNKSLKDPSCGIQRQWHCKLPTCRIM